MLLNLQGTLTRDGEESNDDVTTLSVVVVVFSEKWKSDHHRTILQAITHTDLGDKQCPSQRMYPRLAGNIQCV